MNAPATVLPTPEAQALRSSGIRALWARFRRDKTALTGAALVLVVVGVALIGPRIPTLDPARQDLSARRTPPSRSRPMGLDHLGRDILARIVHGARFTLGAAAVATLIALSVGGTAGLAAGYYGGRTDGIAMRVIDVMLAFPYLLLAILVVAVLGPGLTSAAVAVGVTKIPQYARVVRSTVLTVRHQEFMEAARALGATDSRILARHILPNVVQGIIVLGTVLFGTDVLAIAALSFLGLGAQPPTPEWGLMVSEGRSFLFDAPHIIVLPGLALLALVLGLNLLGDGLRDALDPRLHAKAERP